MTTLSKTNRDDPLTDDRIIPLDFNSINKVPESHSWSHLDEPVDNIQTHDRRVSPIPVIDLASPNAKSLIANACEKWGIFQVINHGVPFELVKRVEFESQKLFALLTHEKCKVLKSGEKVSGYGMVPISTHFDKCMWQEGFTIWGSCVDDAKVLWPHEYQIFCDTMDAYQEQMKLLTHKLLLIILETLDVTEEEEEEFNWVLSTNDSYGPLHLNSYPPCPNPGQALGLAPHTDSHLLTILDQNGISGLEVFVEGLGWSRVQPVEGAFVVNVGDLLHIFSNAKFTSAMHRVIVNQSKHRISVVYFHGPPVEIMVAPSSKFEKPCFKSLLVKEYLSLKAKHLYEALSMVRA
ncbi:gibberellin 3-beta-dioxygenase 1-like [Bidens hawaiensis]|uniref:gibberellin 3-beta-dioxygenase 1-like n=1 Tax=Bidens hawaiensis TaxID=980011 RepID=UPI0040493907